MKVLNLSYHNYPNLPGHEFLHRSVNDLSGQLSEMDRFDPELILEREFNDGKAHYETILRKFMDIPRAFWYIDSHLTLHAKHEYLKLFSHIFVAVSRNVEAIKQIVGHDRVYWLPLCWPNPRDTITLNSEFKELDVSFVGRFQPEQFFKGRVECVNRIRKEYGSRAHIITDYQNMQSIVRRSKVSINYSIRGDLNFRVFEVLGCGTELVTDVVPDFYRIAGLEDRASAYTDLDEMIKQINSILKGDFRHAPIASQRWVSEDHSIENRYEYIVEKVKADI